METKFKELVNEKTLETELQSIKQDFTVELTTIMKDEIANVRVEIHEAFTDLNECNVTVTKLVKAMEQKDERANQHTLNKKQATARTLC